MNKSIFFISIFVFLMMMGVVANVKHFTGGTQFRINSLGNIGANFNFSKAAILINSTTTSNTLAFDPNQIASKESLFVDAMDDINIRTNSPVVNRITIKKGGRVGVGTMTPLEKLHVDGNLNVTGNVYVEGCIIFSGATGSPVTRGVCI